MVENYYLLISIFTSFLVFFFGYKILFKLKFLDIPNKRKIHKNNTVTSGGILIFLNLIISMKLFQFDPFLNKLIVFAFPFCIIGAIDDRNPLRPATKFIILFIFCYLSLYQLEIYKINLGFLENLISRDYSKFLICILSLVLFINAFNYIDGIDGLSVTLFISTFFSINFYLYFEKNYIFINNLYLIIPFLMYLPFNFRLFKKFFFVGNSGSLLSGFIIGIFLIYINSNKNIQLNAFVILWFTAYYIFDFFSTSLIRFTENRSIFEPDKKHLHHIIFLKHNNIVSLLICNLINLSLIFFGLCINFFLKDYYSLFFYILTFLLFHFLKVNYLSLNKN